MESVCSYNQPLMASLSNSCHKSQKSTKMICCHSVDAEREEREEERGGRWERVR